MSFLHNFSPEAVALTIGPLTIYWYGFIIAAAIAAAVIVALQTATYFQINKEIIIDLAIWLIISGLIGARLYEVFLNFSYYFHTPQAIIKIWQGGLAIHGGLIGGLIALLIFTSRKKLDPWKLSAVLAPALALGQAIGRWGNWFNQELFGLPTDKPWGILISPVNRPESYKTFAHFHPTFLYESIGSLVLAGFLYYLVRQKKDSKLIIGIYLIGYGLLRFALEFIKIDPTPIVFGLRWPQIMSLLLIILGVGFIAYKKPQKTY